MSFNKFGILQGEYVFNSASCKQRIVYCHSRNQRIAGLDETVEEVAAGEVRTLKKQYQLLQRGVIVYRKPTR